MAESHLTLPLLPLRSGVLLTGMAFTIALESPEAAAAAEAAGVGGRVLVVPHIEGRYASIGVVAELVEHGELLGGATAVVVRGLDRARLGTGVPGTGNALWVEAEVVVEAEPDETMGELAREYRAVLENILTSRGAARMAAGLREVTNPSRLADISGYSPDLSIEQKVQVLETTDTTERLRLVLGWARQVLADVTLRERIKVDVEEGMEKTQREFLLRRQLEAIQKELRQISDDPDGGTPEDYRARLDTAALPEAVAEAVRKEIDKFERTSEQSPERGWIQTWLDTIFELPFGQVDDDAIDLEAARAVLDGDHDGLDEVKERIIELLAVRKLRQERHLTALGGRGNGAIVTLVGPPGVGKTSLGESIAKAMGRKFVRVALGGVHDEAEIRGHRRTYVGAQPGRIARALAEAGTMNPVILFDEVDKLGHDFRGDPAAALLEVLDPAQNHTFKDHYLEVDLDLSKVVFLATANVLDTVPSPLLDRMEVLRIDGYTEAEKLAIAEHHLLPRQLHHAGLAPTEVELTTEALKRIIGSYTREAGVRSLERALAKVLRKVATKVASGSTDTPVVVAADDVRALLGRVIFEPETLTSGQVPGVVTGLAVTGAGGDVLHVEASVADGPEGLTLTGQLGDVMKESAEIALSYVRSHAEALGIDRQAFHRARFHLHVPAGAVPKDGPSAGIALTTALVSLLTDRPVRREVAMTGEVTLQGRVLPIGGVTQKVLAAHRAGITEVVLPERNRGDLEDLPAEVRDQMVIHLASDVRTVLDAALGRHENVTMQASA